MRKKIVIRKPAYMIEPYLDKGAAVMRYFEITKTCIPGSIPIYADVEIERMFLDPAERKIQKDYQIRDNYVGGQYWIPNNTPGLSTIKPKAGLLWPDSFIAGTCLEYSQIFEYAERYEETRIDSYLETYMHWPQIEMVIKMGMWGLAKNMVNDPWSVIRRINESGRTPAAFLMIAKNKIKTLARNYTTELHEVMIAEKENAIDLPERDEQILAELDIGRSELGDILKCMSVKQFINRTFAYCDLEPDVEWICGMHLAGVRATARMYCDYISMRLQENYDMTNEIFSHPRDLIEAHGRILAETEKKAIDQRLKEVSEKYPGIEKKYETLSERYTFEDDRWSIRPAMNAGEIVTEGRLLHHCVGGDNYLRNHEKGTGIILFMRPTEQKDIPYVTVEVSGFNIRQWYGSYDKKPNEKEIDRWLTEWVKLAEKGINEAV
jgi:hypothetical protein